MKKFILGFLLSSLLFTALPAAASVKDYILYKSQTKIVVDNKEYINDLPVLYLEPGYNYLPVAMFKDICNSIGTTFEYDESTNKIQISTNQKEPIYFTSDGLPIMKIYDDYYVSVISVKRYYNSKEKSFDISTQFEADGKFKFYAYNPDTQSKTTLIDDIPVLKVIHGDYDKYYITSAYYVNHILPIISGYYK